jgi:lysophospholipase L1-like esterase
MKTVTRRSFLTKSISVTALASIVNQPALTAKASATLETKNFSVLFQGDSITDGNRGRDADPNHILGHGFVFSIASILGSKYPSRNLTFMNKGTSGDTTLKLIDRWTNDAINLKPDVLSILVGINDILAEIHNGSAGDSEHFAEHYRQLLLETRKNLPETLIVLGEPFILPVGMVNNNLEKWKRKVATAQAIVKMLADEYNAVFVPFQEGFNKACSLAPAEYWIWDGIHPTYSGHGLMASTWIETVSAHCPQMALN